MDIPGWRDGRRVSIREGRVAVVVVVEERGFGRCTGWDDNDDGVGRGVSPLVVGGLRGSSSSSSASSEDTSSSS